MPPVLIGNKLAFRAGRVVLGTVPYPIQMTRTPAGH